jgi:hypothetical protein
MGALSLKTLQLTYAFSGVNMRSWNNQSSGRVLATLEK